MEVRHLVSKSKLVRHLPPERMDSPSADPNKLRRTYFLFYYLNRLLSGWERIYRSEMRPFLKKNGSATLLDLGCGGGDIAVILFRLAQKDGFSLRITATDPDSRAIAFAQNRWKEPVSWLRALSSDLVREEQTFDFVISNHVLHHLSDAELKMFLHDSSQLSRHNVIHNDLRRNPFALLLFPILSIWFSLHTFIFWDGMLSILKSKTVSDWQQYLPTGWNVRRFFAFRALITWQISKN